MEPQSHMLSSRKEYQTQLLDEEPPIQGQMPSPPIQEHKVVEEPPLRTSSINYNEDVIQKIMESKIAKEEFPRVKEDLQWELKIVQITKAQFPIVKNLYDAHKMHEFVVLFTKA